MLSRRIGADRPLRPVAERDTSVYDIGSSPGDAHDGVEKVPDPQSSGGAGGKLEDPGFLEPRYAFPNCRQAARDVFERAYEPFSTGSLTLRQALDDLAGEDLP